MTDRSLKLVYYDRKIPLKPILNHLGAREERSAKEQSRLLQVDDLVIQKSIVEVKELAENFGVLEDAIERVLERKEFPGYSRLGDMFIRETKLEEIHEILEDHLSSGELNLDKASRIIEEAGGRRPAQILEALGYRIEWQGIDPKSARVKNIRP